jgi:PPOX class probable F420-dependent enzyme
VFDKQSSKDIDERVTNMIKGKNFAFLGTVNKDGSPQVSPVWIDMDENNIIYINTAIGRTKQKNVTRDPRVSISLLDENNPYSMTTIKGKVIEQITEGADGHIDNLAKKYLGVEKYPGHSATSKRVILKIMPEKVFYIPPRYTEYLRK